MALSDDYIKALHADKRSFEEYYQRSFLQKTEQQVLLEKLLLRESLQPSAIADIACGGGSLSFHLSKLYPKANFSLADLNQEAIELARKNLANIPARFFNESIYQLRSFASDQFDLVCCWQTLSWLDKPHVALQELIRIAKPGAKIYLSSLFNLDHDTDLYTKVLDHSRPSSAEALHFNYNTYSKKTIAHWVGQRASHFEIIPFKINIDLKYEGRGIGTFTRKLDNGDRIQLSAGMLLNWGILIITK